MLFSRLKKKELGQEKPVFSTMEPKQREDSSKDIAVIGISARFPDAPDYNQFWENIKQGKDSTKEIPKERWDWKKYYCIDSRIKNRLISRWGCFMDDIDQFDLRFFQLSQREADAMDPQQRILLEEAWSCLEDAGIRPSKVSGSKLGVFVAGCQLDYRDLLERNQETIVPHSTLGIASSLLANRISYFFDFRGPSVAIDTACAGSLTSIHYAIEAIQNNECEMALAGGVNVILSPNNYIRLSKMLVLSPTGALRTFDEAADGYIRGEGVGLVLLKSLDQAIKAGDPIYGVIKSTAINHCGKTKSISFPSSDAQADVIVEAVKKAKVPVESIGYIELHGTGTPKGDPIEFEGLQKAFERLVLDENQKKQKTSFCGLGSVKTNIGHLEGAAGMASIVKMLLAMNHQQLPQTLNFNRLNPAINMDGSSFYLVDQLTDWKRRCNGTNEYPLRAGISSFGLGGVNAHLVLEEYQEKKIEKDRADQYVLICLSAKTEQGLVRKAKELHQFLSRQEESERLQDISYTLLCGRDHFEKRITFVVDSIQSLKERLSEITEATYQQVDKESFDFQQIDELIKQISMEVMDRHTLAYKENLELLAQSYMGGYDAKWEKIFNGFCRRIHLPTYSFEPTKCWIPDATQLVDNILPLEEMEQKNIDEYPVFTYEERWEESKYAQIGPKAEFSAICMILPEGYELSGRLKKLCEEPNRICFYAVAGKEYQKITENRFIFNRTCKEDYQKLFYEAKDICEGSCTIMNLMPLWNNSHRINPEEIMYLLQAISINKFKKADLLVAGSFENETERCYLESWIGFERSVKMAMQNTSIKMVIANGKDYGTESWEELIYEELCLGFSGSVLYEDRKRKILKIQETKLENKKTTLKKNSTYLITGGAGGLGILFARHLLEKYDAHVYLIGRSDVKLKQKVLNELKDIGGKLDYIQADVCDEDKVRDAVANIIASEGRIDGIIHAAGIYQGHNLLEKEKDEFYATLAPKSEGAIAIAKATQHLSYDFICYFSSFAAIVGDMGDCDYSVANRFLQAFARSQNQSNVSDSKKHIVIHWPIWEHGGMELGSSESVQMYLKSSGQKLLADKDGIEMFERTLAQDSSDFLVLCGKRDVISRYIKTEDTAAQNLETLSSIKRSAMATSTISCLEKSQSVINDSVSIESTVINELKEISSSILKFPKEEIHLDSNFADLGYDSVNLLDFAANLSHRFQKDIKPDLFFRYPNIKQLKDYLIEHYPDKLKLMYHTEESVTKNAIEMEELSNRTTQSQEKKYAQEPIAIIGMSGLFPGADNIEDLWKNIIQGNEEIQDIPISRIQFPEDESCSNKGIPWRMGMISNPAQFDPLFFEISPGEAETMDPRQRLLLEEVWKALEDAQLGDDDLDNANIGTFVGVEDGDYRLITGEEVRITSNHNGVLAARLAYFLNLKGASIAINTACSSSLTALHQACLSLKNDDCDAAVVAGASLILKPETYLGMTRSGMISADGTCYAFDRRADGMVPGEAIAVIVLKKFSAAKKDHNHIYATILGTGINYDGKTNGITAPNGKAQADLYRKLYKKIGISPKDIDYIITHGTGTKLGDPIEVNALDEVFREESCGQGSCAITSVKPNIGHTLAASGIVSVISLVLAIRHKMIPGSIHCEQLSEYIRWDQSPLYVNTEKKPWTIKDKKARIGTVNSFGVSGTNVHAVLESYDEDQTIIIKKPLYYLLLVSAKSRKSLKRKLSDMAMTLRQNPDCDLAQVSFALMDGRCHFKYRCAILASNIGEAVQHLEEAAGEKAFGFIFFGEVDRDFYENHMVQESIYQKQKEIRQMEADNEFLTVQFQELMKLYCLGYKISGRELFGDKLICQVKLPFYPFDNQDYWCESKVVVNPSQQQQMTSKQQNVSFESNNLSSENVEDRFLEPIWKLIRYKGPGNSNNLRTMVIYSDLRIKESFANIDSNIRFCEQQNRYTINQLVEQIKVFGLVKHFIWMVPDSAKSQLKDADSKYGQEGTIFYMFRLVKALIQLNYNQEDINISIVSSYGQSVTVDEIPDPNHASVDGFASVLSKEIPNWNVRIYDVENVINAPIKEILHRLAEVNGEVAAYRHGQWFAQELATYEAKASTNTWYQKSGVFVVIGGAGGIGYIWSQYMISNYDAQIIWVGRSGINERIKEKMKRLSSYGKEPIYISGDVTDRQSLNRVYEQIKSIYGHINGVVHSAVGAFDRGIVGMEEGAFQEILRVKTDGSVHMNEVFGLEPLDFVIYFSSLSSFEKTRGQSGYVAGCSFVDAFAKQLQSKVPYAVRTINWGFWGNVGAGEKMPESIKINLGRTGARALGAKEAMGAVETLLREDKVQLGYTRCVKKQEDAMDGPKIEYGCEIPTTQDVKEYCSKKISDILSKVLKISADEFEPKERMVRYGLDSITILQLIREFQKVFPGVEGTIFYEYATIEELTGFILENYAEQLKTSMVLKKKEKFEVVKAVHLQAKSSISAFDEEEPIAVIGMSGKFPKAENLEEYWENLVNGRDCVTEIPSDRWDIESFYNSDIESAIKNQQSYCKTGGFIDGYADFDPRFFKISPAEALTMDPQERYLLEECWRTFEDAGYTSKKIHDRFKGNIGVFVGVTRTGFDYYAPELWNRGEQSLLCTSFSAMSNRISYEFNLNGPSMSIDTMCSSSMTALHEACEHIHRGECEMAILGTANIYSHSATYKQFCQKRMLSKKGRCHAFGIEADGFIPGEGVGAVLLKPLGKAIRDNDQIHCVIRSTVANHGGKTNGFTVPNPVAQKEMILKALQKADVNPEEISYIEAHGTGTKLGDPIEITGLTKAFRNYTDKKQYCAIGSVKTNIGHCEAASGLAGVLKVILQMKHRILVPSLHAEVLNPLIDFENSPFYVQRELSEWKRPVIRKGGIEKEGNRIAGVSSFGAGGSNAHLIIEEFIE